MPRGIPWDELPNFFIKDRKAREDELKKNQKKNTLDEETRIKQLEETKMDVRLNDIGKRVGFGALTGSLTGFAIGLVEVLGNIKLLSRDRTHGTKIMLGHSLRLGGYFALYQGIRRTLYYEVPTLKKEDNMGVALGIAILPLVLTRKGRVLAPYAAGLVILDYINGLDD